MDAEKVVRYVGQTCMGLENRLSGHYSAARTGARPPIAAFIRGELQAGRSIELVPLDQTCTENAARYLEWWWIAHLRAAGCDLLNVTLALPTVNCAGEVNTSWRCDPCAIGRGDDARHPDDCADCRRDLPLGWPVWVDTTTPGYEVVRVLSPVPQSDEHTSQFMDTFAASVVARLRSSPELWNAIKEAVGEAS